MPTPIHFTIRDIAGCRSADIAVEKLTFLCGGNHNGKSSALNACVAAITGVMMPPAMAKKDIAQMVRSGAQAGMVTMTQGDSTVTLRYPSGESKGTGKPPRASLIACGVASPTDMPPEERARTLVNVLKAEPTDDDIKRTCAEAGFADTSAGKVIALVAKHGWDGAHKEVTDANRDAKREWQQLAGENYGSTKAATWLPAGWLPEFALLGIEALQERVSKTKEALEAALRTQGASAAETGALEELAGTAEATKVTLAECESLVALATKNLADAKKAEAALPPSGDDAMKCPHCGEPIVVKRDGPATCLLKVEAVPEGEKKKRQAARTEASLLTTRCDTALRTAVEAKGRAYNAQADALKAAKDLEKVRVGSKGNAASSVEEARAALATAEKAVQMLDAKTKADKAAANIERYATIATMLAADGLRATKLRETIASFNARLADLSAVAGWRDVAVTDALGFSIGGRTVLLSKSEQYRVRTVLQLAIAQLDGSEMVALDNAEILDGAGRNGLLKLLPHVGIPAIVAMTVGRKVVPDLGKAGYGVTLWISDGVALPLADAAEAA